jgi:hypothetical protein
VWDAVDVCRQFKSCEAEKVASRDKGRHCQIDDIAKEGIFEIVHLHPYVYLLPLCPDKSGMKVSFCSVYLHSGVIFFSNRSFVLQSRNLETGQ